MRVNKFVARATGLARRKADSLIGSGQITINDQPAEIGQQVSDADEVKLAGKILNLSTYTYLMLNKPPGYVSSRHSQEGSKTVYELLPTEHRNLKLVGRLDKDSSGLILLTDDGDFAHQMLHPSHGKSKIYQVELDLPLEEEDVMNLQEGVHLEDGLSQLHATAVEGNMVTIEMTEGRNRQIRRTFAPLGYEVVRLHRTDFGPFSLNELPSGENKQISPR